MVMRMIHFVVDVHNDNYLHHHHANDDYGDDANRNDDGNGDDDDDRAKIHQPACWSAVRNINTKIKPKHKARQVKGEKKKKSLR